MPTDLEKNKRKYGRENVVFPYFPNLLLKWDKKIQEILCCPWSDCPLSKFCAIQ